MFPPVDDELLSESRYFILTFDFQILKKLQHSLQNKFAPSFGHVDQLCHRPMSADHPGISVLQKRPHLVESSECCTRERRERKCGGPGSQMAV